MGAPRTVLALDLARRVGWACGADYETPVSGVWVLPPHGDLGARCSALAASLEDAIAVMSPDLVILEAPLPPQAQTAMNSARLQFGLAAVAEMISVERGVPCEEAPAWEVRKLVLGKARVEKEAVVAWCRAQGWRPADHNEADSLVLLRYRHLLSRSRVTAGAESSLQAKV